MSKADFALVILVFDVIVLIISIYFINLLARRLREYIKLFGEQSVEMRDFTVCFRNTLPDHKFASKDMFYQSNLIHHIEGLLKEDFLRVPMELKHLAKLEELDEVKPWEIVDVNFAKRDLRESKLVSRMNEIYREKKKAIVERQRILSRGEMILMERMRVKEFDQRIEDLSIEYKK